MYVEVGGGFTKRYNYFETFIMCESVFVFVS